MKKLEKGTNSTTEELGRKVNEIVAWINKHENADGTNTADTGVQDADATVGVQYPDFEKWKKKWKGEKNEQITERNLYD